MAISPEVKPRVSVTTDYEIPASRTPAAESQKVRLESGSNNSIGYVLGVLVLLVIGYFAYTFSSQDAVVPNFANQSTTTVSPPIVDPALPATEPAAPATAPTTTTTP